MSTNSAKVICAKKSPPYRRGNFFIAVRDCIADSDRTADSGRIVADCNLAGSGRNFVDSGRKVVADCNFAEPGRSFVDSGRTVADCIADFGRNFVVVARKLAVARRSFGRKLVVPPADSC